MAVHEFAIMPQEPTKEVRFDEYEPQKYACIDVLDDAIEEISAAQNIINLYARIGYPEVEDEHLTMNSVGFHEHLGYKLVGRFDECGRKFDTWYDMVLMDK